MGLREAIEAFRCDLRGREPHREIVALFINPTDASQTIASSVFKPRREVVENQDSIAGINAIATTTVASGEVMFLIFCNPGWCFTGLRIDGGILTKDDRNWLDSMEPDFPQ